MSANKATKVDNKNIVDGPATTNDNFDICATVVKVMSKKLGKNSKISVPNYTRREVLSTELMEGMSIKASSYERQARGESR